MQTLQTFHFTTYLSRGRMEREIEVEAEYTFDGSDYELVSAKDVTEGHELSDAEWDRVCDDVALVCEQAYAERMEDELAEYGEYLRDRAMDRRMAA
jgi:hypothetical protein